jgi:CRISPR-associated endonuclease/helicase Cas3
MSDETRPLPPLSLEHFAHFFKALYGYRPFQWLQRLAAQVCTDNWPKYITVPTSSGKTSVIDIAIFALAYRADAANRHR